MSAVVATKISIALGGKPIFDQLSFQIGDRDRVGLIGPNGSGKTTLMRAINGEVRTDQGDLVVTRGVRVGRLPQELAEVPGGTVLESVLDTIPERNELEDTLADLERTLEQTRDAKEQSRLAQRISQAHQDLSLLHARYSPYEAQQILSGLGFKPTDMDRPIEELSGGWRMRAALAGLLFQKPDVLLLDEPTNHLDVPSVRWFDTFLERWDRALVLVCHDRQFLDRHIRRVISFEPEGIRLYSGNYETYLEARGQERLALENRAKNVERKVKQAEKFIERFRYKSTKARQAQSKIKLTEKMRMVADHKTLKEHKTIRFSFPAVERSGRVAISMEALSKRFGDNILFEDLNAHVLRGERIAIVGPNGCGKTTLLRILAGELASDKGKVHLGHNVAVSYYAQHQTDNLHEERSILQELHALVPTASPEFIRGVCGAFLFASDDVYKLIGVLSGGERSRVALSKLLVKPGNLMLMDEPTNHLDLLSSEALIQALQQYEGTLIFVSHNQSFVNRLATQVWDLTGIHMEMFPGNLNDYFHHMSQAEQTPETSAPKTREEQPVQKDHARLDSKAQRKGRALLRQERSRVLAPLKKKVEQLEAQIHRAEERQKEVSALLADEAVYSDTEKSFPLMNEYGLLQETLTDLVEQWESAREKLDQAEREFAASHPEDFGEAAG